MVILALVLLLHGAAAAQSAAAALYNQANALYHSGDFEAARSGYQRVVATGVADSRLFYNLGNACFKSGRLGEAILWYERARRLAPRDEDINANLRFANRVKKDRDPEEENVVWRFLLGVFFFPSLNELCLSFSFFLLLVLTLAVRRVRQRAPARAGWLALVLVCGGLAAANGAFLAARIYHQETVVEAVVVAAQGTARYGPDEEQTAVFIVHEGTKVRIARREDDWLLVRLANGLAGWLPAAALQTI